MAYRLAINGFGRIGRTTFRAAFEHPGVQVVAINDLTDAATLAHLLKYDTVYGVWPHEVTADGNELLVDGQSIPVLSEKDPQKLPWQKLNVAVVLECTGHFTDKAGAMAHIKSGAKTVLISAPTKDEGQVPTGVLGVNKLSITDGPVFSNASCTTNCIAPIMEILERHLGVEQAFMTTAHAYTADQNLQDGPHKDLRRARAAAFNIVPTTTGAAKTVGVVVPSLKGKFDGLALRVPIPVGSVSDITAYLKKDTTVDGLNDLLRREAAGQYQNILMVEDDPVVSSDIVGRLESSIVDSALTAVQGRLVKVVAWYDNERGYSQRFLEQAIELAKQCA
jgi:glyceraldehyde 3-phosphate dehydrogenase